MEDQIILIDKPAGMTSFGVVARVRRKLSEKFGHKVKVGHTGTLDPFATGLLILMSGKKTKDCEKFLKLDKEYIATLCLGKVSTTGDPEGEIGEFKNNSGIMAGGGTSDFENIARFGASKMYIPDASRSDASGMTFLSDKSFSKLDVPTGPAVSEIINSFIGKITQKVPAFSAVKINGHRAYDLARAGKTFETPTREVEIYSIDLLEYDYPILKIRCHVSSGTYIRTLAEDIGQKLGTGAYLTALRRTKIGTYTLKDAKPLEEFLAE